ncbi:MAG: hypothetical protein GQ532_20430 [Methylomarinum sp.]|nr:hypothetical protein [Methylomarinum sp.]
MMVWSINILVLAIGFLIVGMIKPNWIMFWMEKPTRMPIIVLSSVLFMVSAVMFGEANKEKQQAKVEQVVEVTTEKATSEMPKVVEEVK